MTTASTNAVLQAAAKALAWELFVKAGYCRTRAFINVDKFERELLSAARQWRAAHANLHVNPKGQRRKYGRTESQ